MGIPDVGYVYAEMREDIFNEFPEILQILWKENKTSKPELRLKNTFEDKAYADGANSELNEASKELQGLWPEIKSILSSSMLRGWGEDPNAVYVMNKFYTACPTEDYDEEEMKLNGY